MNSDNIQAAPENSSARNIITAFALNLSFAVIELIGGLLTNSVAILSDALHDFGDSLSLGVAYYLQKKSEKKGDKYYSYGYKRFSLLGSVFISVVLLVSSVFIIEESVKRLISPQETNAQGMFILAILGIIVNGAAVLRMKKGKSHNERAVTLHMMEDLLGWFAVLAASIIMIFIDVPVIDPILSVAITVWVLFNVYRNLKETFRIMLQEVPKDVDINKIENELLKIDGVKSVHDLHIWTMDGEKHIMTVHIVTGLTLDSENVTRLKYETRNLIHELNISHITVEIEGENESGDCLYNGTC
ncbi:MAG: cation transporter [Bacteroidales bacterium]|nr:cation transporter [Bacteroidales bacterium]